MTVWRQSRRPLSDNCSIRLNSVWNALSGDGTRLEVVSPGQLANIRRAGMYEPHYEEESAGGGFLIGLLCGTALGAAIGLMFAPRAGSEFRQHLYDSTGDIRRKA